MPGLKLLTNDLTLDMLQSLPYPEKAASLYSTAGLFIFTYLVIRQLDTHMRLVMITSISKAVTIFLN